MAINETTILALTDGLMENILAAFIFLVIYEFFIKNLFYYWRNKGFNGTYYHCDMEKKVTINVGKKHYSKIHINFFNPHTLVIKSYDYTSGKERIWNGRIKLDQTTRQLGFGAFKYEDGVMGVHEVLILDQNTLSFHLFVYKQPGIPYLMVKEGFTK